MTKVVINTCFGGFSLSDEAIRMYLEIKEMPYEERKGRWDKTMFCSPGGEDWDLYDTVIDMDRADPALVKVVENLGFVADGRSAKLKIVDIEAGTRYRIEEYDGREWIEYADDIGWSVA